MSEANDFDVLVILHCKPLAHKALVYIHNTNIQWLQFER
ncbi:hypothetical protein W04_2261 [Pseudoalteromonas sp. SW0106-04]|nr:hypothetical protein W04_2261 [Pseudoalteromonas sp. SW0106-04]